MQGKTRRAWSLGAAIGALLRPATAGAWVVSALITLAGCAGSQAKIEQPLRVVQQARWFTGPDGMHVEVADFADGTSLVRVLGLESEITGKVFAYERVQNGDRLEYRTKLHGGDLYALVKERDGRWVAYVPGAQSGYPLAYLEDKSASVDAAALQRTHREQTASGELAALQRFDRAAEQKHAEAQLATAAARTAEVCGKPLPSTVVWSSVTDAQLLDMSVAGYCESVLSGLARLCEDEVGKRFVAQRVGAVECRLDGDDTLTLDAQRLRWSINFEISNADQKAYAALLALVPAGTGPTLEQQIFAERTAVCADPSGKHVVVLGPREAPHRGMAYGDGGQLSWVSTPEALGGGWFFDPRQRNEKNNDDFRGLDLRLFSHIEADPKTGTCKLTCGARESSLQLLTGAAKSAVLEQASYGPSPMQREPYALARDKAGNYYFVDRGVTEQTARDFRLYKGPRGKLRPLEMKDVVSDSEGEIFASTSGKLRLVLGKQSAQWISGSTATLLLLPLHDNYGLIYNELGVYLSAKLGVPCDDL
jgi:hypothetical protein